MLLAQLKTVAAELDGTVEMDSVMLLRDGVGVQVRFADRGTDEWPDRWTEVRAARPEHYPLTMRIERARVKPGELVVDIELGTPNFDDFFIVEAAPADVMRHLIDEPARQFLMARKGAVELTSTRTQIIFACREWLEAAEISGLIDFVVGVARRVRDAYAAADRAPDEAGAPYRAEAAAGADPQVGREAEIQVIESLQRERLGRSDRMGNWVMLIIFVVVIGGIALGVLLG